MNLTTIPAEFSRAIAVDRLGANGVECDYQASQAECAALAARFGVAAIANLRARATARPRGNDGMWLDVTFEADVLQSCVITLEPVESHVSGRFELVCAPPPRESDDAEVVVEIEAEDPPEPLREGQIDVGELIAQYLAMEIDPYPRAAGLEEGAGPWRTGPEAESDEADGPFGRLRKLKAGR